MYGVRFIYESIREKELESTVEMVVVVVISKRARVYSAHCLGRGASKRCTKERSRGGIGREPSERGASHLW